MSKYIINGGKKLKGEITVAGSKNAVLPLMAACILTEEECVITNVPGIKDVEVMAELLRGLGAMVEYDKPGKKLSIAARRITSTEPRLDLTAKLRASILLAGALLGREKKATLPSSGGDKIGLRPIDSHLSGFRSLGAAIEYKNEAYQLSADRLSGTKIVLEESSVTATENIVMAAVLASGTTTIKLAASEPHVQQLCEFLVSMGAEISGIGTSTLVIKGTTELRGAKIEVIPDSSEAATFITIAAATRSHIIIKKMNPDYLDDFLLKLKLMNVSFEVGADFVEVKEPTGPYKALPKLQVGLYPKLASDDVPVLSVLATQCEGDTIIYEWLYENRLGYSHELNKMGANTQILDPHRVKISGPTPLKGTSLSGSDIRNAMALVAAALTATGESEISNIYHIDRGYERLEERLKEIGADIKRIE
jgi:UDP-N-acetylglucosamine 1-carboxyvinyltransferase